LHYCSLSSSSKILSLLDEWNVLLRRWWGSFVDIFTNIQLPFSLTSHHFNASTTFVILPGFPEDQGGRQEA
jgi:hypothetical protein